MLVRRAGFAEFFLCFALFEGNGIYLSVAAVSCLQTVGKRVHDACAHAVQTAGDTVTAAAEFAAGMKNGEYDFKCRLCNGGVDPGGNAAPVVLDLAASVRAQPHGDIFAVSGKSFVDRVVYYLAYKMMKPLYACRTDIHTRPFAYRFQPFEHLYLSVAVILIGFLFVESAFSYFFQFSLFLSSGQSGEPVSKSVLSQRLLMLSGERPDKYILSP